MKTKLVVLFLLAGTFLGCKKEKTDAVKVEITGQIKKVEYSTYMYGTHSITTSNSWYALISSTVDLNKYLNKQVTVKATKISSSPIEGGPDYYDVIEVK